MIRLSAVRLAYGDKTVLTDLTAHFEAGEVVALMGPSGSGKSTLMSALAGRLDISGGSLTFNSGGRSLRESTEWIHQSSPMLMRRTVLDNAILAALIQGEHRSAASGRALQLMTSVGIGHLADQQCYTVSGGERQRLAVVRSLMSDRPVLLADEPTASLDAHSRESICASLQVAGGLGRVVIVATHDGYVADRCDRVITLDLK